MHNENKRVMLGLELHTEILLDELASDVIFINAIQMPLIPSTGFELFSYLWKAPHEEEDMDMQPGRKVASNPQLFHSHNYRSLERLIPKCFSRFIPQRGFCSVPQILVPSTLS